MNENKYTETGQMYTYKTYIEPYFMFTVSKP